MPNKVIGLDNDEERIVRGEWQEFKKTLAYKRMMEYAATNGETLLKYSEDMSMPGPENRAITLDLDKSMSLLQRRAGIGIMTSYIRIYTE